MKALINQVETLEGIDGRSLISIIGELNGAIKDAQEKGYRVAAIHTVVANRVNIGLDSFKTLLYRFRKKASGSKAIQQHETLRSRTTSKKVSGVFDSKAATQRSQNKLAQFGKGKKP